MWCKNRNRKTMLEASKPGSERLELREATRRRIDSRKSLEERTASERLPSETPYNAQDRPSRFDPPPLVEVGGGVIVG